VIDSQNPTDTAWLRARKLRRTTTAAEKRLWQKLRHLDVQGSHFRRQVPIGAYIADFACMAARLLIELDGSQHGEASKKIRDDARTRWPEKEGYRVVRIWNNEISRNLNGVMERIYAEIHGSMNAEPQVLKHKRSKRSQR
jgi:very-short-patch-repair endonuclease